MARIGSFMRDLWVFGYGSLMWRPGFDAVEAVEARVQGWHRALCVYSWFHRGSQQHPGLVLGLDRGGSCRGMAFRVAAKEADAVLAYLREREQVTSVYRELTRPVALADGSGRVVEAVLYVVDRAHVQYAGKLSRERIHDLVRHGVGHSGANPDYVLNTVEHLEALGIHDPTLSWLVKALQHDPEPHRPATIDDIE